MSINLINLSRQKGFTIIELMVGLVIGLIATLIIMQTFSNFEGNKRTTTGIADAQTNGSIGLYMIQRELQFAGYGVPVSSGTLPEIKKLPEQMQFQDYVGKTQAEINAIYAAKVALYSAKLTTDAAVVAQGKNFSAMKCNPAPILNLDADNDPGTADVPVDIITPAIITDGAAGNDIITIQYGTTSRGALPTVINTVAGTTVVGVANNLGCRAGDVVLTLGDSNKGDTACVGSKVTSVEVADGAGNKWLDNVGNSNQMLVINNAGMYSPGLTRKIACLGQVRQSIFQISNNNELLKNTRPIVTEIVALQAQYGVSATANSEIVNQWVDATGGTWGASPLAIGARNRIKAVRVALVARNNLLENAAVSQACTGGAAGLANVCIWGNQNVNLPDANWANYRYRTYEIVIPLRNVLAASPQL
jgi:type IV pilus assembly protein PilW